MRSVLLAATLGLLGARPAEACPHERACILTGVPVSTAGSATWVAIARVRHQRGADRSAPEDPTTGPRRARGPTPSSRAPDPPAIRTVSLRLVVDDRAPAEPASMQLDAAPPAAADGREMPWIWAVLKREVVQRLPRYEEARRFSLMLSPVVVAGSFDTVPGLGVAGDF